MKIQIDLKNTVLEKLSGRAKVKAYVIDFKINKNNKTISAQLVKESADANSSSSEDEEEEQ